MGDSRECNQMGSSENMDDDSGLELSLGLSCGGFGCKTKVKDAVKEIYSEQGAGDQVKSGKNSGDTFVKVDLCANTAKEDNAVKQSNEPVPPVQESFWMNLGKATAKETENSTEMHANQVQFPGFREPWFTGETSIQGQKSSADTEKAKRDKQDRMTIFNQQQEVQEPEITRESAEEKWQEARKKRKMTVEEQKQQTKGDKEDDRDDPHCKSKSGIPSQLKSSPISANTQDASSSENEDTADSEVEASMLRTVSPIVKYNMKQPMPSVSEVSDKNENQMPITRTMVIGSDINKEHNSTSFMPPVAIASTPLPYSLPSFNVGHAPYSHSFQVANNPSVAFSAGFSLPYLMQFAPPTVNGPDRSTVHPVNSTGVQLPPNYSPYQLPALETSPSWVSVSHSHQPLMFGSKTIGGTRKSSEHADDESKISQAASQASQVSLGVISATGERTLPDNQKPESANPLMKNERQSERTCSDRGTSLSSKAVDDDGKHGVAWSKDHTNHLPMADGLSQEVWNLRPGIAPGLKFGGTGNSPDLPWVSTTGIGSNGKTISGVMYRRFKFG
ncbi:hypothetical protein SUGI_0830890 [Cryptomeria japonica]|nr:hypothetical protein SUGI_0830890 [Cryptomeria japonica]